MSQAVSSGPRLCAKANTHRTLHDANCDGIRGGESGRCKYAFEHFSIHKNHNFSLWPQSASYTVRCTGRQARARGSHMPFSVIHTTCCTAHTYTHTAHAAGRICARFVFGTIRCCYFFLFSSSLPRMGTQQSLGWAQNESIIYSEFNFPCGHNPISFVS